MFKATSPWTHWYQYELGPGGKPSDANHLNKDIRMGNLAPAGMGMEDIGFEINKIGGIGHFVGGMENMGQFGSGMNIGKINEIPRNALNNERSLQSREEVQLETRSLHGPWDGEDGPWHCGAGMEPMDTCLGYGMDQVGSAIERMGLVLDHLSSVECMGSAENMNP